MAGRAHVWPATRDKVLDLIGPALRDSRTVVEAAGKLGVTDASLRGVCRFHGIPYRDFLRAAIVPPVLQPERPPEPEPPPLLDWKGARSTSSGVERRVVLGDLHIPFHSLPACATALAVVRLLQPKVIVQLGDLWNMGAVSHHPRPFGGRENHAGSLAQGRSFLEALRRAAPASEIWVVLGNHDMWAEEYEDERSEFAGMFSARQVLDSERLGIKVHPRSRKPLILGPVGYHHGHGGGDLFAKRYAMEDAAHAGVRYYKVAHHHTVQLYCARNGCECMGVGWLGRPEPEAFHYAKNNSGWRAALVVEDVCGDLVTSTPVGGLETGRALFGGRVITA